MTPLRVLILLVALAVGAAFVFGLVLPGVRGGVLLIGVGVILAALSARAWEALPPPRRVTRVLVLALIVVVAVVKVATGR